MQTREIKAKSILRKHKKLDSWFLSSCGMNLYRGCGHNCVYCDGRAEKYQVEGDFGCQIEVKTNAPEILQRELDPRKRRTPLKGYILLGGGVGDSYQPAEAKYLLARKTLEILGEYRYPVHILTKSILVKRDIDLIKKIDQQSGAVVSFSFSTVDEKISSIFEPGVPSPKQRLETINYFHEQGLTCGMFLMPVLPFLSDKRELMEDSIRSAKEAGVSFIIFAGMTLKPGRQMEYYYRVLKEHYPDLITEYQNIYGNNPWGMAKEEYNNSQHQTFALLHKKYKVPARMPLSLYKKFVTADDLVILLLEQIDYLLKLRGVSSPYGYAAYSLSQLKEPIQLWQNKLKSIRGIGPKTETIILEIIRKGTCDLYEELI